MLARLCRSCNPKNIPPHRCGPAMQAPTSNRQGSRKNSFALSKFHRRGEHCSPALAAAATQKIFPRTVSGPAMQAPTSERQGSRKISIALLQFHGRGEHCSPALAVSANPKISPAPLRACHAGPYKQKIQACVKILSLFQNFIVGASIARPPKPCGITRPSGWSRAPPLP